MRTIRRGSHDAIRRTLERHGELTDCLADLGVERSVASKRALDLIRLGKRWPVASGTWTYETDCVGCPGPNASEAIQGMVDAAGPISRATFLRYVDREQLRAIETALGYERWARNGLTMAGDYHVSYHRSIFRGLPCVYFAHSSIEHVFLAAGTGDVTSSHIARGVARTRHLR